MDCDSALSEGMEIVVTDGSRFGSDAGRSRRDLRNLLSLRQMSLCFRANSIRL